MGDGSKHGMVAMTAMVWQLGEENMRRKMSKAIKNFELRHLNFKHTEVLKTW